MIPMSEALDRHLTMLFCTLFVTVLLQSVHGSLFDTCLDLAKKNWKVNDGTRVFKPPKSSVTEHIIFCQFLDGYGYTFIPTTIFTDTDLYRYNVDFSDFKVVFLGKDGNQFETIITPGNNDYFISGDFLDKESLVDDIVRNKQMLPYVKLSLMTRADNNPETPLVYTANGLNASASACNKELHQEPSILWSFLFNRQDNSPIDEEHGQSDAEYLRKWVESVKNVGPRPASVSLPRNFFSFFEMGYSLCDDYVTTDDFPDIIGAAVGIKFVIKCPEPESVMYADYVVTGYRYKDTLNYVCDPGYEIFNNQTITCSEKGEWKGDLPYCKVIKPRSCVDVQKLFGATLPGEYVIYSSYNSPSIVYCEFHEDHVVTFLHPVGLLGISFSDLFNDNSEVILRARYPYGEQVESVLRQIDENKEVPIKVSFSYSKTLSVFFESPVRIKDYGGEPENASIGYNVNGKDVEYFNEFCCYNERERAFVISVFIDQVYTVRGPEAAPYTDPVDTKWLTEAEPLPGEKRMPEGLFHDFYMYSAGRPVKLKELPLITGITIGVRYNF